MELLTTFLVYFVFFFLIYSACYITYKLLTSSHFWALVGGIIGVSISMLLLIGWQAS